MRSNIIKTAFVFLLFISLTVSASDQYTDNPKVFSVMGIPAGFGDHFMAFDVNRDGKLDYLYRTVDKVYAYSHDGDFLWERLIELPGQEKNAVKHSVNGATLAAGDIYLNGLAEVLVMNDDNQVVILEGITGESIDTLTILVNSNQEATYLQIVNLRGQGDVDLIVQTTDEKGEGAPPGEKQYFYINRSIIAYRLDTKAELWRVNQDRAGSSGETLYEGYWGQAHGSFFAADADGDGLDEVIGATMIDHDGTLVDLAYPRGWVGTDQNTFTDHLDCIAVGNFFPDAVGLAWCLTQEDHWGTSDEWHTALVNKDGVIWREETALFSLSDKEPQNAAVGRFSSSSEPVYVWNRSRFENVDNSGNGQQPWVFDNTGVQAATYFQKDFLPEGFSEDTRNGVEVIWTIDWDGSGKEHIAAKARRSRWHAGVFDAITANPEWTSLSLLSDTMYVVTLYAADVSGDSREELIVFDKTDTTIKIFHNSAPFTDTNPDKWDDPLYRRLKQNWDYYSPGSYTAGDPVQLSVRVFLEGPYNSGASAMNTSLLSGGHLPAASPYPQAPKILVSADDIPADAVDWVMIELRAALDRHAVYRHSAFLRSDGQIMDENGNAYVNVFADKNNSYYIVIRHRNHLAVVSERPVNFSTGTASWDFTDNLAQYYGNDAALLMEGVYGMWAGDGNQSGIVTIADINVSLNNRDHVGYHLGDHNLSGIVTISDANIAFKNRDAATNVQQ